jgi:hypothetical protein
MTKKQHPRLAGIRHWTGRYWVILWLVAITASDSFSHLRALATADGQQHGWDATFGALIPDTMAICAAMEMARDRRSGHDIKTFSWPRVVFFGALSLTLAGNLAGAQPTFWSWIWHGIGAAALMIAVGFAERRYNIEHKHQPSSARVTDTARKRPADTDTAKARIPDTGSAPIPDTGKTDTGNGYRRADTGSRPPRRASAAVGDRKPDEPKYVMPAGDWHLPPGPHREAEHLAFLQEFAAAFAEANGYRRAISANVLVDVFSIGKQTGVALMAMYRDAEREAQAKEALG